MVREVASKTSDVAGTVLAQAIFREGVKNVAAGANPMGLKRGIEQAVKAAVAELGKLSKPVEGEMISQVGGGIGEQRQNDRCAYRRGDEESRQRRSDYG